MSTSTLAIKHDPQPAPVVSAAPEPPPPPASKPRAQDPLWLLRAYKLFAAIGLGVINPVIRLCRGESSRQQLQELWHLLGIPLVAIAVFLFAWSQTSSRIQTSLGQIPGPIAVFHQAQSLWADHQAEREKAAVFYERQVKRNADKLAKNPNAEIRQVKYTGKPT
jgi:nitrate/nitrite transport system permease protein